jgi:hypothetical protein
VTPDELAEIAAQLVARVRDDPVRDNARWLALMVPSPTDWFRLCFALAAAVPDDQSWHELTLWTDPFGGPDTPAAIQRRRKELNEALRWRAA